jgi:hypothetical protein
MSYIITYIVLIIFMMIFYLTTNEIGFTIFYNGICRNVIPDKFSK